MIRPTTPMLAALAVLAATPAVAEPALTLYQQGPALVSESRPITSGSETITVEGLPAGLLPGSVSLSGVRVGALSFAPAAGRHDLLRAMVGKEITVVRSTGAGEVEERARVLRADPEPLLEIAGKIVPGLPGEPRFDALPPGVAVVPTLTATLTAPAEKGSVALRYLTGGLSWSAEHVVDLGAKDTLALTTRARLVNDTAQAWRDAKVALVAGDVASEAPPPPMPYMARESAPMKMASVMADGGAPAREQMGAWHLYQVPGTVSLDAGTSRLVTLSAMEKLEAETLYRVTGPAFGSRRGDTEPVHAETLLTFTNASEAPLPAGVVRVYGRDSGGADRFLGADRIDAIPAGAEVKLTLGQAFDVTAERAVVETTRISDRETQAAHRVVLRNARDTKATVRVETALPGDWAVQTESAPHERVDAGTARWTIEVPAKGETTLTYTVRTTF